MTREEFKAKAKGVVDAQTFGKLGKLFEYDDYDDMKIAYIPDDLMSSEADMPLDDFLDDIYEQIVKSLETPIHRDRTVQDFVDRCRECGREKVLDKIIAEIEEIETYDGIYIDRAYVLQIIDKYKAEMESEE